MPQHIEYDDVRIRQFMIEKQANEIEMAWDLQEVFNRHESLVGPLRQLASFAVDELDALRRASPEGQRAVSVRWERERTGPKNRAIVKFQSLSNIANNVPGLTAEECSDVIRIYGEVVEECAELLKHQPQKQGFVPPPSNPLQPYQALSAQKKNDFRLGGDPVWKEGRQRESKAPLADTPVKEFIGSQRGGISNTSLKDTSTVLKIDRAFGLMEAADISGTTTDSIFFVDRFSRLFAAQFQQDLFRGALDDPIFQLLALATLIAGGHHSVLESALSLSLNHRLTDVCYKIGLYTSLLPETSRHPAKGAIQHVLELAERNTRNRLMLVYYDRPQSIGGGLLFAKQGAERALFARIAEAGLGLLQRFRQLPSPWPTKQHLTGIFPELTQVLNPAGQPELAHAGTH